MNYFELIEKFFLGNVGVFLLIIIAYKIGLLEFLKDWKRNGKNGNGFKKEFEELRENHLHEISNKLDRLIEKENEGNLISKEILLILKK